MASASPTPSSKSVRIVDMARHLGISARAVSQALFEREDSTTRVSEGTVRRVRDLAAKWNYRTNVSARTMQGALLRQIGVLIEYNPASQRGPTRGMEAVVAMASHLEATDYGLNIIQDKRELDSEAIMPRYLREHVLDGVIVDSYGEEKDDPVIRDLRRFSIPFVLMNAEADQNCVTVNDRLGATLATDHLIELGHRRIAYVSGGIKGHYSLGTRQAAYQAAMKKAALRPLVWHYPKAPARAGETRLQRTAAHELRKEDFFQNLYLKEKPTAIVCYSDGDAILLLQALQERGVSVPQDVSVIGYDDMPYMDLHFPALTTIRTDTYGMGRQAAEMLLKLLAHPKKKLSPRFLLPELVIRKSTSEPKR